MTADRWQTFFLLSKIPGLRHAFVLRVPGLDFHGVDRAEACARLEAPHRQVLKAAGFAGWPLVQGEQVHGAKIVTVDATLLQDSPQALSIPEVDGLITNLRGVALLVYVADCAAVYLVDPSKQAIGLVHSGKKGTELGISAQAVKLLGQTFGTKPEDLYVVVSPCIRPPAYEVDFAAKIREQCLEAGVSDARYFDCGLCTHRDPEKYYSYRREKGKTGRLLAVLGWEKA